MDHKNLEYFMSNQKLNHQQAQWALYLSRFNFMLKHILGSKMSKADCHKLHSANNSMSTCTIPTVQDASESP